MIDSVIFIGAVIAGVTQFIKGFHPKISGSVTIAVAVLVGVLVALLDTHVGVTDITIAQGIMIALGASGVVSGVQNVGIKSTSKVKDLK